MEMAMRATEDVAMGEDVTPPIAPLSRPLRRLPPLPLLLLLLLPLSSSSSSSSVSARRHLPLLLPLYCSARCSSSAESLRLPSAEELLLRSPSAAAAAAVPGDTSDLRAALRLVLLLLARGLDASSWRIGGLLTNREKLTSGESSGDGEVVERIRSGARVLATARRKLGLGGGGGGGGGDVEGDVVLEEAALCATITNAVEVQDVDGRGLGIAVYGTEFSWINHSCSANACYRFQFSGPEISASAPGESRLRIVPYGDRAQMDSVGCRPAEVGKDYGPKIIVRSIKAIKKGEEVTVAYTDLLQPKAARQSELQSKYQFRCSCTRCDAEPLGYVDQALQDFRAAYGYVSEDSANCSIYRDEAARRLSELMDDVISEYLSDSDPKSCCERLESLLTERVLDEDFAVKAGYKQKFLLQPLHHLSLNAYITLASAYRIHSSQLVASQIQAVALVSKTLEFGRISGAYSLLLAGAVHHLFRSESSLMASAATFWVTAGESLLSLSRNSAWSIFSEKSQTARSLVTEPHACRCSLMKKVMVRPFWNPAVYADFENISGDFMGCIAVLTKMIWGFLARGSHYLQAVKDPVDFGWLGTVEIVNEYNFGAHLDDTGLDFYCERDQTYKLHASYDQERRPLLFQLGVHCLMYGGLLWSICYGRTPPILDVLSNENDMAECSLD
ncbi:protein SET DOMAIN GROUP 41 isoform X2 [Eucalyptus grandis]|uniref:protein SET DOMAIN GROUP 41 isoform X2 n=1 Tax=Eucalyptus grandis TaxID=71139 RepID=UPI00192E8F55|nr:protein SET DOMAIN GROUP 41 isoform X2 [Eucalyptus grandis]